MALIHEKIAEIMKKIPAIGKKKSEDGQIKFKFRGIDDVYNAASPVLAEAGVFIVPNVVETKLEDFTTKGGSLMHRAILTVRFDFTATDGSFISATVNGEGMDSGDKATSKAMSIAMKYAMFQVFFIPTEEMRLSDPDNEIPEEQYPANTLICEGCNEIIKPIRKADGTVIQPEEIAQKSLEKYGRTLCYKCCKAEAGK